MKTLLERRTAERVLQLGNSPIPRDAISAVWGFEKTERESDGEWWLEPVFIHSKMTEHHQAVHVAKVSGTSRALNQTRFREPVVTSNPLEEGQSQSLSAWCLSGLFVFLGVVYKMTFCLIKVLVVF